MIPTFGADCLQWLEYERLQSLWVHWEWGTSCLKGFNGSKSGGTPAISTMNSPGTTFGVPVTCKNSVSFRVAEASLLLLRPYRNHEEDQWIPQVNPVAPNTVPSRRSLSAHCPAKRNPESWIDFLIGLLLLHRTSLYWYEMISDSTSAQGEMGYIGCQALEISVVVYSSDRLRLLTKLFPYNPVDLLTKERWRKVVQYYHKQRGMV